MAYKSTKKIAVQPEVTLANHHVSPHNSLPYASFAARDLSRYSFDAIAASSPFSGPAPYASCVDLKPQRFISFLGELRPRSRSAGWC